MVDIDVDIRAFGLRVIAIGVTRLGGLMRRDGSLIPFDCNDHVRTVLEHLRDIVGSTETAFVCLVCKVLADAYGDDVLTSDDYDALANLSEGQVKRPEIAALSTFISSGVDETSELVKAAELLVRMLSGSLCAHALKHLVDALDVEFAQRPDIPIAAYVLERDQRIATLMAAA